MFGKCLQRVKFFFSPARRLTKNKVNIYYKMFAYNIVASITLHNEQ